MVHFVLHHVMEILHAHTEDTHAWRIRKGEQIEREKKMKRYGTNGTKRKLLSI